MKKFETVYKAFLDECHDKNLKRELIAIEPEKSLKIKVDGKSYVNFASNDYLGLKDHPKLSKRAIEWSEKYGSGSGASRLVTGNLSSFSEIEQKLANIKGKEAALVLASGFQANAAVLQALFDVKILKNAPFVAADKLNHASMHFGCAAANVKQNRYRHLDSNHCAEILSKASGQDAKYILTETVFSMDGDVAPIDQLAKIAGEENAMLLADDAHGFGVLGENGEGLSGEADLVIGTFSKAMGSFGAYVAGSQAMIDYLIQRCGGLIYSTALPPMLLGAIDASLDLLPKLDEERQRVKNYAANFREAVQALGFETGCSQTQIVPIIVGDAKTALDLSNSLKQQGLWVTAIRPPTVPNNTARLRVAFSASHKQADVERLIKAIEKYKSLKGAA